MEPRKKAILSALDKFVRQRAGLEFGNYGDVTAYRAEQRSITKDLHQYRALERAVLLHDSITADMLLDAARSAYSGRLTLADPLCDGVIMEQHVEYCTGQYFPTEYRRAACAVLASALWAWTREHAMPKGELKHNSETGETLERYNGLRAGDWLRSHFAREFGRGIASRWFS